MIMIIIDSNNVIKHFSAGNTRIDHANRGLPVILSVNQPT